MDDVNLRIVADRIVAAREPEVSTTGLDFMLSRSHEVERVGSAAPVAGIDSSDNVLLQIPDIPGAAVAGYSFSLVLSDPDGHIVAERNRAVERADGHEDLLIEVLYQLPTRHDQRLQSIADYQWRTLMSAPYGRVPYLDDYPIHKLRLTAARARDLTEKRALRIFLNQDRFKVGLLLRDGRLSAQNVSTRYTDDLARLFVRRGVRWVGVVKQGSLLWNTLHPYHRALSNRYEGRGYWAPVAPQLIWETYGNDDQTQPKTLLLGARESQSLGGVGGFWVLYSPNPRTFYVLEFNVYDMEAFRPLVDSGLPLVNGDGRGAALAVVRERGGTWSGTQLDATDEDFERLVVPTINEIHYYSTLSALAPGYPITLADAHNRCKITRARKDRKNLELKAELMRRGYHAVDFDAFEEDPHKSFEL